VIPAVAKVAPGELTAVATTSVSNLLRPIDIPWLLSRFSNVRNSGAAEASAAA